MITDGARTAYEVRLRVRALRFTGYFAQKLSDTIQSGTIQNKKISPKKTRDNWFIVNIGGEAIRYILNELWPAVGLGIPTRSLRRRRVG
ncbi:hypothetical protein DRN94_004545 [archaeon]|nr:hypothetical protein [archaeon]